LFRVAAAAGGAWLAFNLLAGLEPLYTDPAYQRADYRGIVRDIDAALEPGDAIVLDAPNQQEVFNYYYRGDAPVYALPPGLGGDDEATRAAVRDLIDAHERVFVVFWGEAERDPNRVVETTLDALAFEVGDQWYGDVRLARYVMPGALEAPVEADVRFGEHITLERYALSSETVAPGDVLQVQLQWRADEIIMTRYKVFVQLLDEDGVLVAQRDSEPGGGLALTTTWGPGELVVDNHGLRLPDDLPPAHYLLIMGLYDINQPAARLAVEDGDFLRLASITVTDPSGETS
jgi:mannosyltransferase